MRLAYILVNGVLIMLGYIAIVNTDFDSPSTFRSVLLPLVDMLYCVYLLLLMFVEIYNRTWR